MYDEIKKQNRNRKRISPLFCNPNVSVAEETMQAQEWKQVQRDSEARSRKLTSEWRIAVNPSSGKYAITPEMISRARECPIDKLIDVGRGAMSACISGTHADNRPSMSLKNNFAYCYACGYHGDVIAVYMKLHGCNFVAAVRALQ